MFVTVAVIFIVLATFLLIIYNMYVDYVTKKDADAKALLSRSRNIINECEELLLNQAQIPFTKNLVLILRYRILNALTRLKNDPYVKNVDERIVDQQRQINDVIANYREDIAFRPPENDQVAVQQLRAIRQLRKIIYAEMRHGTRVDTVSCQREERRLHLLVLKVNISNLMQRVLELRRLQQVGSCRQLIEKGLDVIRTSPIHDAWLDDKAASLNQMRSDLESDLRQRNEKEREKLIRKEQQATQAAHASSKDLDEIFGDKKKW